MDIGFWVIIFIVLLIIEATTVNLVTIWFALGALFAYLASIIGLSLDLQMTIFILVSIISLIVTRPLVKKFNTKNKVNLNYHMLVGRKSYVTEDISEINAGAIIIDGKRWMAIADKKIKKGSLVEVKEVRGSKVKVEEIEGE